MFWITSAVELKAIADTLKDVLTQCWFLFEPNQIKLVNVDPEKVATVYMEIRPPHDKYNCLQSITFSTFIQVVYKVLRGTKTGEIAKLTCEDGVKLQIEVQDEKLNTKMKIDLNSLADPMPKYTVPYQFYDKSIKLNTSKLYYLLHDLGAISRVFTLNVNDSKVSFEAQDETGTSLIFCEEVNNLQYRYRSSFLTKFVEKFLKPKISKHVSFRLKNGSPLSVVANLDYGFLEMTIAPLG